MPVYKVDPFWPKPLPNNWLFGQVASVAVGPDDHVLDLGCGVLDSRGERRAQI